jgi:uncharacterized protein YigA (DUF484 family)
MNREKAITAKTISNAHLRKTIQKLERQMDQALSTARFNEEVQKNISELESDLSAPDTPEDLFRALLTGVKTQFGISTFSVCLSRHFFEELFSDLGSDRVGRKRNGLDSVRTIHEEKLRNLFQSGPEPILRGHLDHGSPDLFPVKLLNGIKSEAVIPLLCDRKIVGTVNLGDPSPERFLDGLGTAFLKRLSRTLSAHLEKIFWKRRVSNPRDGSERLLGKETISGFQPDREWLEELESSLADCIRLAEEFGEEKTKDSLDRLRTWIGRTVPQNSQSPKVPQETGPAAENPPNVIPLPLEKKRNE